LQPFVQPPLVEERRLAVQELLDLLAAGGRPPRPAPVGRHPARPAAAAVPTGGFRPSTCSPCARPCPCACHSRQKARRGDSSVNSRGPSRCMPRETSDHSTSFTAKPSWHASSTSTSSAVPKPPGPRNNW